MAFKVYYSASLRLIVFPDRIGAVNLRPPLTAPTIADARNQLLEFVATTTAILLVERVDTALSPALRVLLLGFPILDTSWSVVRRLLGGRSPFMPDRGHIHHKLLALGFKHYGAVSLIYVMGGFLICTTFYVRYQSDTLILCLFVAFCVVVVGLISLVEWCGWRCIGSTRRPPDHRDRGCFGAGGCRSARRKSWRLGSPIPGSRRVSGSPRPTRYRRSVLGRDRGAGCRHRVAAGSAAFDE